MGLLARLEAGPAIAKRRADENAGRIPYICRGCGLVNWPERGTMRAICVKCEHPRFPLRVEYPGAHR